MARNITLTLGAGLGADLGPNFNLTADVGSVTPSTATKSELTAGKGVSVDDLATEVTITSTGTCTNSISQLIPCAGSTTSTTSTTTTTTAAPSVTLNVYAKELNDITATIMMSVNGGTPVQIGTISQSNCTFIYTDNSLNQGDSVNFTELYNYSVGGNSSATCPASANACYYFTFLSNGTNDVALTFDMTNAC